MSHAGVVEVSLKFLGDMLGEDVYCAEVDNMAQVVRLLVSTNKEQPEIPGVAPATVRRCHDFESAFTVLRYPGQPPAFVSKAHRP